MRYLVIITLSTLLFLGVGWGIGAFAHEILEVQDEEVKLAILLGPIGAGTALGFCVGVLAALFTAIERRGVRQRTDAEHARELH